MSFGLEIEVAGEQVSLLPERALFWPRRNTVFIADTHWGKAAAMRAAAIPVPGGTTGESLRRLDQVLAHTGAERLVLLGDCIHARQGRAENTLATIAHWRQSHSALDIELIRGNHDHRAGDPPPEFRIRCVDAPACEAPFVFRHFPVASDAGYTLSGHLHPAIRLYGTGAQRATLPCFWFQKNVGVLPAFGPLTGAAKIKPSPGDRVCPIAGDEVLLIPY